VALAEYRRRWETLDPVEKWNETFHGYGSIQEVMVVSGVHGLRLEESVRLLTMGSTSRGVLRREWEIPLTGLEVHAFSFYPQANVLAIAGNEDETDFE
jgi:hypothetical protein